MPYSFFYWQTISLACSCTNLTTSFKEYLRIVVFLEVVEVLLGDALWHELFPRARVDVLSKIVDSDVFAILQITTIDEHRHTDGDTTKDADGILAHLLLFLHLLTSCLFFIGKRSLWLLLWLIVTTSLFFIKATVIDNNVLTRVLRWSTTDDAFQFIKLFYLNIIQFKESIIVERVVVEARVYNTLDVGMLQASKQLVNIITSCLTTLQGNDREEIEQFLQTLAMFLCLFAGASWSLGCLCHHGEHSVRSKVKDVSISLLLSVDLSRTLNTEDGLHVVGSTCLSRTAEHEYGCPFLDSHTSCEFATRKGDGIVLLRFLDDGITNLLQCFTLWVIRITITCHIDYIKVAEDRMLLQFVLKGKSLLHSWH